MPNPAILVMWHGVAAGHDAEYAQWHTHQHLPERTSIPGFESGLRGVAPDEPAATRYLTIYRGHDVSSFDSHAYRERLNNPTSWTQKMQPHITDLARRTFEVVCESGFGTGPYVTTIQINSGQAPQDIAEALLPATQPGESGVARYLVGRQTSTPTNTGTAEAALRPDSAEDSPSFSHLLVVHSIDEPTAAQVLAAARQANGDDLEIIAAQQYTLSQFLTHQEAIHS